MDGEKRKDHRQTLKYPAKIDVGDGTQVACVLSDVSASGARITVDFPEKIPDRFSLLLAPEHTALRNCKVVWRVAHQIGVEFLKAPVVKNGPRLRNAFKDSTRVP